ncbi:hypothetical protein C0J52_01545 [Blattella germanica]|nr:hypothetical protein C0J52_01545 [Blattella germanica]
MDQSCGFSFLFSKRKEMKKMIAKWRVTSCNMIYLKDKIVKLYISYHNFLFLFSCIFIFLCPPPIRFNYFYYNLSFRNQLFVAKHFTSYKQTIEGIVQRICCNITSYISFTIISYRLFIYIAMKLKHGIQITLSYMVFGSSCYFVNSNELHFVLISLIMTSDHKKILICFISFEAFAWHNNFKEFLLKLPTLCNEVTLETNQFVEKHTDYNFVDSKYALLNLERILQCQNIELLEISISKFVLDTKFDVVDIDLSYPYENLEVPHVT